MSHKSSDYTIANVKQEGIREAWHALNGYGFTPTIEDTANDGDMQMMAYRGWNDGRFLHAIMRLGYARRFQVWSVEFLSIAVYSRPLSINTSVVHLAVPLEDPDLLSGKRFLTHNGKWLKQANDLSKENDPEAWIVKTGRDLRSLFTAYDDAAASFFKLKPVFLG